VCKKNQDRNLVIWQNGKSYFKMKQFEAKKKLLFKKEIEYLSINQ
jgi:hypothetical protein